MKYLLISAILFSFYSEAQTSKYFVRFSDKNNSPYSVFNPSAFLSSRAINRRLLQGIPIQQNDLPVNQNYIDSVVSKGAVLFTRSKWFNGVTIEADSATLSAVQSLPFVQQVSNVHRVRSNESHREQVGDKFRKPEGLFRSDLPQMQSLSYGESFNQIHIMNGDYLHDAGYHGEHMVIALLDGGFYHVDTLPAFDSLLTNNQVLGTWDFVANETSVYEDNDHGMEVLSTIGGNIPGKLIGTAPKADFWLLRTEDVPSEFLVEEYNWDAGAEFADSAGADIISTSLGYTTFQNPAENHTYADMNGHTTPATIAANTAFSKGMLVVASAGNSGGGGWQYIGAPADGNNVLTVGGVDAGGNYASFSSTGPSSDGDIKPNVAAVGVAATISIFTGAIYNSGTGTSFACPILAGSAACLWQAFPGKTNREIFDAIERSASQYTVPDFFLGYGIPDFKLAYHLLGLGKGSSAYDDLISVYPNPFSDQAEIKFYSASNQAIEIAAYDMLGKLISKTNERVWGSLFNTIDLSLPDLSHGIYFLKITSSQNSFVKKVMRY